MALWAVLLTRLDLQGESVGRLPLFAFGMILTFNLGRDITLITLYTFFFGLGIIWWLDRSSRRPKRRRKISGGRRVIGHSGNVGQRQNLGSASYFTPSPDAGKWNVSGQGDSKGQQPQL